MKNKSQYYQCLYENAMIFTISFNCKEYPTRYWLFVVFIMRKVMFDL